MRDCLSQDEVTDLLSDAAVADRVVTAHLGQCSDCQAVVDAARRAHVPTLPMRFTVLRQLGAGGMGTVYEALDRAHGTHVALKVLQRVSPDAILRFKREFRALQSLEHPNLVRLGELVVDGEQWAFTMELLDGVAFVEHVRGHFDTTADTAPALAGYDDARLCDGLAQLVRGVLALHAAGKVPST
ncbi:MAG: hypothetical protein E6J90_29560 [Deltaproteobacteria bacterium]|nr:MAG: hypothetical protein E6J90_29560 [Deltaproteobacteria bacterium]TMQ20161.1 MAG: hypothetical protein E6J91_04470 [Deltaproteobacteria bacterium]